MNAHNVSISAQAASMHLYWFACRVSQTLSVQASCKQLLVLPICDPRGVNMTHMVPVWPCTDGHVKATQVHKQATNVTSELHEKKQSSLKPFAQSLFKAD